MTWTHDEARELAEQTLAGRWTHWEWLARQHAENVLALQQDMLAEKLRHLRTAGQALSDRIVEQADQQFVLEPGSRETLAAFREALSAG